MSVHAYRGMEQWADVNCPPKKMSSLDARSLRLVFDPASPETGEHPQSRYSGPRTSQNFECKAGSGLILLSSADHRRIQSQMGLTPATGSSHQDGQCLCFGQARLHASPNWVTEKSVTFTVASLDPSLNNADLYLDCEIQEVAGRLALMTPVKEAVNIVGRNAKKIVDGLVSNGVEEVTLSGAMAIWAYLVVFHIVDHRFRRVYYDDGKPNGKILIAAH